MDNEVQYPHCDDLVLHAPGKCQYCDMHPDWQQARIDTGVNFTDESVPGRKQCPAEARRSRDTINRWGGNVAQPLEDTNAKGCPKCGDPGKWINLALVCPTHGFFG